MPKTRQAIIVGAGHNGLAAAFYLARAGLRTTVLERRGIIGGCAVTEEIDPQAAPGCRVSTASYMASMLRPEIIRDLQLERHGLRMVAADPALQIALPGGRVLPWWNDRARTRDELAVYDRRDAAAFFELDDRLKELASHLQGFFMEPPPNTDARGLAGFLELLRVGRRFRGLDGRQMAELLEFLTGSLEQLLQRYFHSEEIRRLVLANNLYGKHGGPRDPGSAMGLLFHLLPGGSHGAQGYSGHVIGGMGAITAAMAAACREAGVDLRTSSPVASIDSAGGSVRGVTLVGGEALEADLVLSNADPKTTFLRLLGPGDLAPDFLDAVRSIQMNGPAAKVNLVLDEAPAFTGMPPDAPPLQRMVATLVPTLADAQAGYNAAQEGRLTDRLWVDCVWASAVDPTLCPQGREVLTTFIQYVPYHLAEGDWDSRRTWLGDRVVQIIGDYAPNVPGSVIARDVITPLDLERRFGICEGNIFHGDIRLDQLFFMRPLPGWAHYRTPIEGLYLCGAGTHPGGGVTGAPGYNAAHAVLRRLR